MSIQKYARFAKHGDAICVLVHEALDGSVSCSVQHVQESVAFGFGLLDIINEFDKVDSSKGLHTGEGAAHMRGDLNVVNASQYMQCNSNTTYCKEPLDILRRHFKCQVGEEELEVVVQWSYGNVLGAAGAHDIVSN